MATNTTTNDTPEDVRDAWNALGGPFPKCLALSRGRRSRLAARLREPLFRGNWRECLARIQKSAFLRGENARGWRANIDWLAQPDALAKVLEGRYDDAPDTVTKSRLEKEEEARARYDEEEWGRRRDGALAQSEARRAKRERWRREWEEGRRDTNKTAP